MKNKARNSVTTDRTFLCGRLAFLKQNSTLLLKCPIFLAHWLSPYSRGETNSLVWWTQTPVAVSFVEDITIKFSCLPLAPWLWIASENPPKDPVVSAWVCSCNEFTWGWGKYQVIHSWNQAFTVYLYVYLEIQIDSVYLYARRFSKGFTTFSFIYFSVQTYEVGIDFISISEMGKLRHIEVK